MNKLLRNFLIISGSILASGAIIVLPFTFFLQPKNELVVGNFQSYMANDVQHELGQKYNIIYQYYGTNAEIPTYIKNKTLDLAVATNNMIAQLAIEEQIQPVPWDKFNLTYLDENNNIQSVRTYIDLKNIVTDTTWILCDYIGKSVGLGNLLEYCVPYFMQKFLFAYRGTKIPNLLDDSSYSDIFAYISNSSRFTNKSSSIMMIQDARSVYDVASLVKNNVINDGINPKNGILTQQSNNNIAPSISELNIVYNAISDYYTNKENKNIITFNSDSSILLNKLALNQIHGAFLYTGDVIYSALNGDNLDNSTGLPSFEPNKRDFYAISPKDNFFAMDGFVFNKSLSGKKLDDACNFISELVLSGINDNTPIDELDGDGNYKYYSVRNFDSILYTPCYKKIYDFGVDEYFGKISNNQELINFLSSVLSINASEIKHNNIELPLNNLTESNLNVAFESFKNRL